jgi:LacI family transcriptional regulator
MSTIFDIAREAGVSITTVSRALNGHSDVSAATRERIVQIARRRNYYPSAAARSLQGKRTNTIAFAPVLHDHAESESFFKEFLGLLTLSSFRHDLSLLATVADSPEDTAEIYRGLAGTGRVDGIILADIRPNDDRITLLHEIGVPFVAFGRTLDYMDLTYPLVDVDGAAGMSVVLTYICQRGHRRIAYLSGPFNTSYALHRYSGYSDTLAAFNITEDPRLVIKDLQEPQQTEQAVASLLSLPSGERPTALVTSNDRLAVQVLYALGQHGISAGQGDDQIAVTGFDDLPFAAYLTPPLTTVRQPLQAICDTLVNLLVSLMKTRDIHPHHDQATHPNITWIGPAQALIKPELMPRASA